VVPGVASDGRAANRLSYIAQVSEEELLDDKHTESQSQVDENANQGGSHTLLASATEGRISELSAESHADLWARISHCCAVNIHCVDLLRTRCQSFAVSAVLR
jgi:hypothetical protein